MTIEELVEMRNGLVMVSSIQLANRFEKRHSEILRGVRNLIKQEGVDPNWVARNIARYVYEGDNGKGNPAYWLTRDAYSMMAMGFKLNNPTVVRWKFAF